MLVNIFCNQLQPRGNLVTTTRGDLKFIDLTGLPLDEVKRRVARLPEHTVIFYIGINVGGALGPLAIPLAQNFFGLRAGFGAGAFFMAVGVVQFYFTKKHLGEAGLRSSTVHASERYEHRQSIRRAGQHGP